MNNMNIKKRKIINRLKELAGENVINIMIWTVFIIIYMNNDYTSFRHFFTKQFFLMAFITMGVFIEMLCGDFDIAFAAQISCSTVIGAYCMTRTGKLWMACLVILAVNVLAGILKGTLMAVFRMPTLIMTLALQIIFSNLFAGITGGDSIQFPMAENYYDNPVFQGGVILLFGAMLLLAALFLYRTYYGKYCRMLGENMILAEAGGLKLGPILVIIHVVAAFFFAVPAFVMLVQTGSGSSTLGSSYLYRALAAACLGGIGIQNGKGKLSGILAGTASMLLIIFVLTDTGYLNRLESILEGGIILFTILLKCFKDEKPAKN